MNMKSWRTRSILVELLFQKKCEVGGTLRSLDECGSAITNSPATTPLIHGPFTPLDPSSVDGTSTKMVMDGNRTSGITTLETETIDMFPRQCAIMMVDKETGVPAESAVILEGTKGCYINAMDSREGHDDKNVIVAGGYLTYGGQFRIKTSSCIPIPKLQPFGASKSCKDDQTHIEADLRSDTAFVLLIEEDGEICWVIQPWLTLLNSSDRHKCDCVWRPC